MKFSQLKRTPLYNPKYTPGPGYYSAVSEKIDSNEFKSEQAPSFSRLDRFSEDSFAQSKLGPGSYKVQKSDFDKYNFTNRDGSKESKKGSADFHRLNVVPSIPSKNVNEGYEDIGNGILVATKDLKELDFNIGPGSYNPSYNYCKPRSINVTIKGNEPTNISTKLALDHQSSLSNQQESIQSRAIGLASGLAVGSEDEKQDNFKIPGQRFKAELTSLISRDPKKAKVGEYNLELLMLRERQLARDEKAPAPGKYYNEQLHSSFRVNRKPLEFQCFDSTTQRFIKENTVNNSIGPGQYDLTMNKENNEGVSFGREKRSRSDVSVSKDKQNPGPGDYNINQMIDIGEKDKCDLIRLKQSHLTFFSAFGAGAQRFSNQQTQTPPPGTYNLRSIFNKRKTRTKTVFIQNNRLISPLKQTLADQQNLVPITGSNQQNDSQNRQTNQPTSVFKSNTQRFNERRSKSAKNQQANQSDIGPGFYDVICDISKQRVSKNIKKDLMDTSARELFQRNKLSNNSNVKVGPGYYEPNIEGIKPKSVFIAAFL